MDIIQAFNIYPEDSKDDTTTITNEFGYSIPYLFIKQVKDVVGNYGAWAMKNSSGGVTIAGNSAFGGYDSSTGLFSYYTTSDYSTPTGTRTSSNLTSDIKDIYATYSAFSVLRDTAQSVISWGGGSTDDEKACGGQWYMSSYNSSLLSLQKIVLSQH